MSLKDKLLIIFVTLLWGFNFVIIKWGIESINATTMTALRFLFTSIPLIFFIKKPSNISIFTVAIYGVLFGVGLWGLVNISISLGTPAGMASLLLQMSAFFSVAVGYICFKEPMSITKMCGIFIAFVGFIILIFNNLSLPEVGLFLIMISAIFWTACNTIIKVSLVTL